MLSVRARAACAAGPDRALLRERRADLRRARPGGLLRALPGGHLRGRGPDARRRGAGERDRGDPRHAGPARAHRQRPAAGGGLRRRGAGLRPTEVSAPVTIAWAESPCRTPSSATVAAGPSTIHNYEVVVEVEWTWTARNSPRCSASSCRPRDLDDDSRRVPRPGRLRSSTRSWRGRRASTRPRSRAASSSSSNRASKIPAAPLRGALHPRRKAPRPFCAGALLESQSQGSFVSRCGL